MHKKINIQKVIVKFPKQVQLRQLSLNDKPARFQQGFVSQWHVKYTQNYQC